MSAFIYYDLRGYTQVTPDKDRQNTPRLRNQGDGDFRQLFFGRLVCPSTLR